MSGDAIAEPMLTEELPEKPSVTFEPKDESGDIANCGNTGNDMGISTVGFRSSKFNPAEWHESNYAKYYQSFVDRDNSEKICNNSSAVLKETAATTKATQDAATKLLTERLHDVNFWKFELNREIQDVIAETDLLLVQEKRLQKAIRATEVPLHIATDNLNCRKRREGVDLVQDEVELSLLKEVQIINNVKDLLTRTLEQTEKQIINNRDAKQQLEMDWSDKLEASELDAFAGNLRNHHTNKQFYPGSAKFQEIQSTPESWAQFSHDNIVRAEHERMASTQLRTLVDNVLTDTSRDMVEQCNTVNQAFTQRIDEMQDALNKLEEHLGKVCGDITKMEKNIEALKQGIRDKDDPMKVAQTRLETRSYRPGVDLCRDPAQYKLVGEVHEIAQSVDALQAQLDNSNNNLKSLMDDRLKLEEECRMKRNSIFIDKNKCVTHRTSYPTTMRLLGYQ